VYGEITITPPPPGAAAHSVPRPPHWDFTITLIHTTPRRTPLDEWSVRRRDLTTHNAYKRQTSIPPGGIRTLIPSQLAAADLAATEVTCTGKLPLLNSQIHAKHVTSRSSYRSRTLRFDHRPLTLSASFMPDPDDDRCDLVSECTFS